MSGRNCRRSSKTNLGCSVVRPVIELRGVGKLYRKLEQRPTLLGTLAPFKPEARHELWALRDVDLEVMQGETIGVLGRNGAGKTTLLRLLAGVTRPTTGRVRVDGRIGPLIGLGVGFHGEMSGRENVLMNGMLLGLGAREARARFDQIVEFAELERFIDTPVKFYSSGMFMRLGFAVIAHIDPTILLVDEVLAVGDARFQRKCFSRLDELQRQGATIVMVSHSAYMIRQLCERAVIIRQGRIEYDGDVESAITLHEGALCGAARPDAEAPVEFVECRFTEGGAEWRHARYDEFVELDVRLRFNRPVEDPVITVGAVTSMGLFGGFDTTAEGDSWRTFHAGEEAVVRITFPVRFAGGTYRIVLDVKDGVNGERLARRDDLRLTVAEREGSSGLADVCAEIRVAESRSAELEQVEPHRL
jgi:lipopolysaccharide transport system ATP-binding protein